MCSDVGATTALTKTPTVTCSQCCRFLDKELGGEPVIEIAGSNVLCVRLYVRASPILGTMRKQAQCSQDDHHIRDKAYRSNVRAAAPERHPAQVSAPAGG